MNELTKLNSSVTQTPEKFPKLYDSPASKLRDSGRTRKKIFTNDQHSGSKFNPYIRIGDHKRYIHLNPTSK